MELMDVAMPSLVFFSTWCALLLLAQLWREVWNWLDDHARPIAHNPLMAWVLRVCFRNRVEAGDVWLYVLLVTFWPLYLAGVVIFFSARGARGLRRWYKHRNAATVSA
ncbi:hypothetical protein [Pseudomonas sp. TWP3-2]|uniref:hypothetical protein n=1 Tax=Pseudomonas sp. TWP3-2 TaxID=2804574 RepID=UPI003CEC37E4